MISCFQAPTYDVIPEISFNNIVFSEGATEIAADTLILTINFKDGDGNLGLTKSTADASAPYNDLWYLRYDDFYVDYDAEESINYVTYSDRTDPKYVDFLPPYEFPYFCQNYNIIDQDTFYVESNEYHHNIIVDYYVKKNGTYTKFDFETAFDPICGENFHGRFPLLNESLRDRPLEGTLKYKMESVGFKFLFRLDTLALEVYIYDRALNKSNVIRTPDFVLENITIGG